ncbi:hypothetical protein F5Y06DRAFT_307220 [Hypoxylon sp. FL0890]|nr:hypothetical protein F5Y06DRAFT_307220 [Hypoxylon sp. FL0890]
MSRRSQSRNSLRSRSSEGSISGESDHRLSYYSDEGAALVAARIKSFFDPDPRFRWEDTIGAGANGIVYRLQYKSARIAVKIAPVDVDLGEGYKSYEEDGAPPPAESLSLTLEKNLLRRLRGCVHIIQSLDIPQDPLQLTPTGVQPHRMRDWLFMEYAENGSVQLFVQRHLNQYPGELLPCRLLWRFFMCQLAYYGLTTHDGRKVDLTRIPLESLQSIPPGPLVHGDMYPTNMVVGALMPQIQPPEHTISPNLKLIDFGAAENYNRTEDKFQRTGSARNIWDIGEIMRYLITLRQDSAERVEVTVDGKTFNIFGDSMERAREELIARGIDPLLIGIVYCCLSHQEATRPGLIELATRVHHQVMNRGPNGVERETDQAILKRVSTLILDADTRKRSREDDADSENGRTKRSKVDEGPEVIGPAPPPRTFRIQRKKKQP